MSIKFHKALTAVLGLIVAASALSGCSLLPVEEKQLEPPLVEPVQEQFDLYTVKRADIADNLSGDAVFESDKTDYLYFKDSGKRLSSLNVKLGDTVKKGQVVLTTDNDDLKMKVQLQQIAVEKSKISLRQAMQEKSEDDPDIQIMKLDLQSQVIQLTSLQNQLVDSVLMASMDGVVTNIDSSIKQGDSIPAFDQLVTITDPKRMDLVYLASQDDLAGVSINMKATIKYKDKTYAGKVVQTPLTAPPSENAAVQDRNAKSIIIMPTVVLPTDIQLGDHAEIEIIKQQRNQVLVIPRGGLKSYMGRNYVQVLEGDSRKQLDVVPGIKNGTDVEIREGLKEGQKVIMNN